MAPVILVVFLIPYLALWHKELTAQFDSLLNGVLKNGRIGMLAPYFGWGAIAMIGGIIAHELLHGLGWAPFTNTGLRSLHFGFASPEMTPYAHCKEPLPAFAYRIGILLPGLALGIAPAIVAIIKGCFSMLCFGIFFTWAASGDFMMWWMIRKLRNNTLVMDDPGKLGCFIL
jgi:hypothetical protein